MTEELREKIARTIRGFTYRIQNFYSEELSYELAEQIVLLIEPLLKEERQAGRREVLSEIMSPDELEGELERWGF